MNPVRFGKDYIFIVHACTLWDDKHCLRSPINPDMQKLTSRGHTPCKFSEKRGRLVCEKCTASKIQIQMLINLKTAQHPTSGTVNRRKDGTKQIFFTEEVFPYNMNIKLSEGSCRFSAVGL